jgi:serine protease Do
MRRAITALALAGTVGLGIGAGQALVDGSLGSTPAFADAAAMPALTPEATVIEVTRRVTPAVVSITSRGGAGSGFVIREDGVILTNAHVVGGMRTVQVGMANGETYTGEVLGRVADIDVAVVKVAARGLPVVPLGDSDQIQVGQSAIAIGNPAGYERSVTTGVVSAVNRRIAGTYLDELIQTDAAINPGNSGGPLLDSSGRVIGINTAVLRATRVGDPLVGIGFAVPVNTARDVAEQLLSTGVVTRAYFGIATRDVALLARQFRMPTDEGIVVIEVGPGTPAARAGIAPRDIITQIDDTPIANEADFRRLVRTSRPNQTVRVSGIRGTQPFTVQVRLGAAEASQ